MRVYSFVMRAIGSDNLESCEGGKGINPWRAYVVIFWLIEECGELAEEY